MAILKHYQSPQFSSLLWQLCLSPFWLDAWYLKRVFALQLRLDAFPIWSIELVCCYSALDWCMYNLDNLISIPAYLFTEFCHRYTSIVFALNGFYIFQFTRDIDIDIVRPSAETSDSRKYVCVRRLVLHGHFQYSRVQASLYFQQYLQAVRDLGRDFVISVPMAYQILTERLQKASQLKRSMATIINDLKTQYDVCITTVNFFAILQWKVNQIISF